MFQCTIHHTLSFPHCVLKSFLYVCVSFAALHVGLLVLSILHVYVLKYDTCLSLSDLLHSLHNQLYYGRGFQKRRALIAHLCSTRGNTFNRLLSASIVFKSQQVLPKLKAPSYNFQNITNVPVHMNSKNKVANEQYCFKPTLQAQFAVSGWMSYSDAYQYWSSGFLLLTLILSSEFISGVAVDINRLEVSNNDYLKPFLLFQHFTNIFKQLLCVRHFSGCWLKHSGTMHNYCLHWNLLSNEWQLL